MPLVPGVVYKTEKLEERKDVEERYKVIHKVLREFGAGTQRSEGIGVEGLDKGSCHFGSSAVGRPNPASAMFGFSGFQTCALTAERPVVALATFPLNFRAQFRSSKFISIIAIYLCTCGLLELVIKKKKHGNNAGNASRILEIFFIFQTCGKFDMACGLVSLATFLACTSTYKRSQVICQSRDVGGSISFNAYWMYLLAHNTANYSPLLTGASPILMRLDLTLEPASFLFDPPPAIALYLLRQEFSLYRVLTRLLAPQAQTHPRDPLGRARRFCSKFSRTERLQLVDDVMQLCAHLVRFLIRASSRLARNTWFSSRARNASDIAFGRPAAPRSSESAVGVFLDGQ
ncbi:hypothetical protein B0H16DRAFT_1462430 [Mycena metata]|uniref:Uncharacterized protein n=1 Tax=Mycena metata TaxID=1033252 RepID=A0AAD7N5C9_9AGAR|nr:hypothetical protein B0H16DRAFT_1462430 [Mycena metata]